MLLTKMRQGRGTGVPQVEAASLLRRCHLNKDRKEVRDQAVQIDILREWEDTLGRENSKCKDSGVGICICVC